MTMGFYIDLCQLVNYHRQPMGSIRSISWSCSFTIFDMGLIFVTTSISALIMTLHSCSC